MLPHLELDRSRSQISAGDDQPTCIDFSDARHLVLIGFENGNVRLYDAANLKPIASIAPLATATGKVTPVHAIAVSHDGQRLLVACEHDSKVRLYDLAKLNAPTLLTTAPDAELLAFDWSPDDRLVVTMTWERVASQGQPTFRKWNALTHKQTAMIRGAHIVCTADYSGLIRFVNGGRVIAGLGTRLWTLDSNLTIYEEQDFSPAPADGEPDEFAGSYTDAAGDCFVRFSDGGIDEYLGDEPNGWTFLPTSQSTRCFAAYDESTTAEVGRYTSPDDQYTVSVTSPEFSTISSMPTNEPLVADRWPFALHWESRDRLSFFALCKSDQGYQINRFRLYVSPGQVAYPRPQPQGPASGGGGIFYTPATRP